MRSFFFSSAAVHGCRCVSPVGMVGVLLLVACMLAAGTASGAAPSVMLKRRGEGNGTAAGGTFTGQGTYYGANRGESGNCGLFNPVPAPGTVDVVALNTAQYGTAEYCGACVEIHGAGGSAIARVVDRCPGCQSGDLDMAEELFPKIDDVAKGRVPISWSFVNCPESFVSGPVVYYFMPGSNGDNLSMQVRNHRMPVSSVTMNGKKLWRDANNFFMGAGVGAGPYEMVVTSKDGQTITDVGIEIVEGETPGQSQFN